ncbi:MAG: msrA, partial [Thermoleophilia bacterium]|nr:msrA [Thermoleophilia bacterium]
DTRIAEFGAGCFWGLEVTFRNVEGVVDVAVGYEGGHVPNPTYEQVCVGSSGHAEAVRVEFDPDVVSYDALVGILFDNHDPTTRNRQGWDVGSQYRSVIFVRDATQRATALRIIRALEDSRIFRGPITTTIEEASTFWRAEERHQNYLVKHGRATCRI